MTYPSLPMAGFTAWAVGAHFAMASVRIDSRRGLGVNEQFMALAPTGYGKEEIRAPFEILARELQEKARPTGVPAAWLRSEERRGGKECVSTGRSRWARYH